MRDYTPIHLGFDAFAEDGTPVPNGMPPALWRYRGTRDFEGTISNVAFRESTLPGFLASAGRRVIFNCVDVLAQTEQRWFYLLRPYGVPRLDGPLANLRRQVRLAIARGACNLVIDYSHEGYSQWMFTRLYEALSATDMPPERVVLLSGDAGVQAEHDHFLSRQGILRPARVHHVNWFRAHTAAAAHSLLERGQLFDWKSAAAKHDRRHLYLCFNRRNRLHRVLTVTRLLHRGLLGDGLVSLEAEFEGRPNEQAFADEAVRFGVSKSVLPELRQNYPSLAAQLPLHVDAFEMSTNHAHTYIAWPYEESWLSLITESLFFESGQHQIFLSEKTFKPMLFFHPFILIGDAHSLAHLKKLGFRTFHPHIDESYDSEPRPLRRLDAALSELQRLAALRKDQRHDWYTALSDRLRHNRNRLLCSKSADRLDSWANGSS